MKASDIKYDTTLKSIMENLEQHIKEEETEFFPKLEKMLGNDKLEQLGTQIETAKKLAPTRPHPNAPNTYPANMLNVGATPIDKMKDMGREFPKK